MKPKRQGLTLSRETVRLLTADALRRVRGGMQTKNCPTSELNETCSDVFTTTAACPEHSDLCRTPACL